MTIIDHCAVCHDEPANIICPYCGHPPVQSVEEWEEEAKAWRRFKRSILITFVFAVITMLIALYSSVKHF